MTLAFLHVYLLRKGAYRDFLYIFLKHTHKATSWYQKYLHRRKGGGGGGGVMTAINMCSNFGGFRLGSPLKSYIHGIYDFTF